MTILELREKRNKAWEAAKAFVETKRDKDGLLSAEDAASYVKWNRKSRTTALKSSVWSRWRLWTRSFPSLRQRHSPQSH